MIKINNNVAVITTDPIRINIDVAGDDIINFIADYLVEKCSANLIDDNDYRVIVKAILQNVEEKLPEGE